MPASQIGRRASRNRSQTSRLVGWLSRAPSRWHTEDVAVKTLASSARGIAFSMSSSLPARSVAGHATGDVPRRVPQTISHALAAGTPNRPDSRQSQVRRGADRSPASPRITGHSERSAESIPQYAALQRSWHLSSGPLRGSDAALHVQQVRAAVERIVIGPPPGRRVAADGLVASELGLQHSFAASQRR